MKRHFTLEQLAAQTNSKLVGDPKHQIFNVADLESATSEDASFLSNPNYEKAMRTSKAGVVFVSKDVLLEHGKNYLINESPSRAFQQTLEAILGDQYHEQTGFSGIHPTAVIHPSAVIGKDVILGPHAVIDKDAVVGSGTFIGAGTFIGIGTIIGEKCYIYPNVTIRERCNIGNRVIIQPGAVIGSCGFGYTTDQNGVHTKLNQVGNVLIEDDVEIGANTTIDRSRFKSTIVRKGSKIDNLVQLGHGVVVGEHNIIVSQTGIAGSTTTGNHVVLGGQVAVAGHLNITSGTMVAGKSGVSKSILKAGKYGGIPAVPLQEYNRNSVLLRNFEKFLDELKQLKEEYKKHRQ